MKKRIIYVGFVSFLLGSASLYSCTSDGNGDNQPKIREDRKEIVLTGATRATADDLKDFYFRFTLDAARFLKSETSDNVVVSPLSASIVLSMLANGVENQTSTDILTYLGTNDIQSLNQLGSTLLTALPNADKLTDMALANSVWVNKEMVSLTSDFSSIIKGVYGAEIRNECFKTDNEKVIDAINRWGAEHTKGHIHRYLDNLAHDSYAILLNALYLKAPWDGKLFRAEDTRQGVFHGSRGDSDVEMMYTNFNGERHSYAYDDNFEMFSIPLGNSAFSMQIILPRGIIPIEDAIDKLTEDGLDKLNRTHDYVLEVRIPKFKTENKYTLDEMLSATGLSSLFSPTFTMFENKVPGAVIFKQATSFGIDEEGAEIAAISSGELITTDLPARGTYEITLDRPFFFFINEYSTGACLLSGLIADL